MSDKTKIQTIDSLIEDLKKVYEEARDGMMPMKDAKEIANVAGKMIKSAALKMEYNRYKGVDTDIDFLKDK